MDHDVRAAVFDGTAEHYDDDTFHARVAEALVGPLPSGPELVVDVATGTGFAAYAALRLKPARVLAVDLSMAMLARAEAKAAALDPDGRIEWRVGPAVPMPAEDHSADVVLCASSLHFLGAVAFTDWLRVLKPGGRLAFSVVSGARMPSRAGRQSTNQRTANRCGNEGHGWLQGMGWCGRRGRAPVPLAAWRLRWDWRWARWVALRTSRRSRRR